MDDLTEIVEGSEPSSAVPAAPSPPISSRFLFVDVAALRAKQLRRGARLRLEPDPAGPVHHKPERLAMEEVRHGLVSYEVPEWKSGRVEDEG